MQTVIKIHEKDNVAVALNTLSAGQEVQTESNFIRIQEEIPAGHKFALADLKPGDEAVKYGYSIGKVTRAVGIGEWVHTHNLRSGLGELLDYQYEPIISKEQVQNLHNRPAQEDDLYFSGYRRENGLVGIRNEIFIIPTVGCVNDIARLLERKSRALLADGVDNIIAFTHPYGCSQLGDDHHNTQKILAGLIRHPNAAGVLVLGLGCENNNIDEMKKQLGSCPKKRVKFLNCQDWEDETEEGMRLIRELISYALEYQREQISVRELIIGLKCGGSDGLSGITANPLVGEFSDRLISNGGVAVLTEVPEMFGAEQILMNRCTNRSIFEKAVKLINDFKNYYREHNQPVYENPSPGNKKGGITTLEDKSLGCTQKSGSSPIAGVLDYGEQVDGKGLFLLSAPGNDLVASTALAAAGAQIILFTTGRGTPFGAPVPTIKISSNSALAQKKKGWIDFDAGRLLTNSTLSGLSDELYRMVIEVASGKMVKNEENGFHDFAIFKQGVTL